MKEFLTQYGIFLAESLTLMLEVLALILGITLILGRGKLRKKTGSLTIKKINDHLQEVKAELSKDMLATKAAKKSFLKELKQKQKAAEKQAEVAKKRIFVLNFMGDIKASCVDSLREEITAILTIASAQDEVVVKLDSGGGMMHAYGLAASQLMRLRARHIYLTIAIDKIAASGGYMMAAVANKILAAPFAIIGSIGVVAQIPNFNRLLEKNNVDYEIITAGEFKRTLTVFGKNTEKAREKFKEEIEDAHHLFKDFITQNRPIVDINKVSTGEHWFAVRAQQLNLVDELTTSDDYLLKASETADIYEITYVIKKSWREKFSLFAQSYLAFLLPNRTDIVS